MVAKIAIYWVASNVLVLTSLFLPAGTFAYWQAWLFLGVGGVCGSLTVLYLAKSDRELLERRLRGPMQEARGAQKFIATAMYLCLFFSIVLSALDHRFGWTGNAPLLVFVGNLLVVAGMYLYFLVYRENRFAAATVEIAEDQRVVSTGPYGIVRHPLYVALVTVAAGIPLALESYWGLIFIVPLVALVVWRLLDEEALLAKNLNGYAEYQVQTRWRLIPGFF
ncbi:MAG TPA: isoprenylcysteine carboxylmethyltransferase family protein [Candidatus Baltobacteraceae bacterium]|nr:isoprenylcysteine carboxylmethyltransferase family protein [Candidatus Baltobacteraceae bacterium]